jgi:DNA polymerase elongation subunit (family B)
MPQRCLLPQEGSRMSPPKICVLDIETAPIQGYTWGLWKQNIGLNQIIDPGRVLGLGWKWLGKPVEWASEFHDDDMVQKAWQVYDRADIVVHFNGTSFDLPWLRREFVARELPPPSPVLEIDLLRVARKQFKLPSYKLQFIAEHLGLGSKLSHEGFPLWIKCMAGDEKAWDRMRRYCMQDVRLTEKVYKRLLPWIDNHPHVGMMENATEVRTCRNCGSEKLQRRGEAYTKACAYPRFHCTACGAWSRGPRRLRSAA